MRKRMFNPGLRLVDWWGSWRGCVMMCQAWEAPFDMKDIADALVGVRAGLEGEREVDLRGREGVLGGGGGGREDVCV